MKKNPAHEQATEAGALAGLAIVVLVWGVNFSVLKDALAVLDPLLFNALRFTLAGALLRAIHRGRPLPSLPRADLVRLAALGLVGHTAYQLTFIYGLDNTLAGNGAIILAAAPIWTVVIAVLLGHAESRAGLWLATAAGALGIILVMVGSGAAVGLGASHVKGDLLVGVSSLCWALYTVTGRDLILRYGAFSVTTWSLWIGGVPLVLMGIPGALAMDWRLVTPLVWGEILFAALGAVALAYVLWYRAVDRLGSPLTALWSNLVPCVALLVAWAWLGERPTALQLTGAVGIVASVALARRSVRASEARSQPRSGQVGRS